MENFAIHSNGRPLSLPISFSTPSPTSPVAECCTCSYLSKSSGNIYQKRSDKKNSLSRKKKRLSPLTVGPKLTWSVFKSKSKSFAFDTESVTSKKSSRSSFVQGSKSNGCSRTSSWIYSQSKEGDRGLPLKMEKRDLKLSRSKDSLYPEKTHQPVITPTYETAYRIQATFNPQVALLKSTEKSAASSEPHDLRKILLDKTTNQTTENKSFERADIPRAPGPLDGSLYAQIRKKKKTAKTALLSSSRAYHSADEISCPKAVPKAEMEIKRSGEGGSAFLTDDHATKENPENPAVLKSSLNEDSSRRASHDKKSPTNVDGVAECGHHSVVERHRDEGEQPNIPGGPRGGSDDVTSASGEKLAEENRNVKTSNEAHSSDFTTAESSPACLTPDDKTGNTKHRIEELSTKNRTETCDNLQPTDVKTPEPASPASPVTSDSEEMRRQVKKQLTKEEVQEAVALINECLSDQGLRNGSILTNGAPLHVNDVKQTELRTLASEDVKAPTFSPVSPDYTSSEANRLYGNKSPEYALPDRDVIHKNVQTRTAEIRMQKNSFSSSTLPDSYLDDVIDSMMVSKTSSERSEARVSNSVLSPVTNRFSEPPQGDFSRKNVSSSDVDSGIDGSTLNASVKTEMKASLREESTSLVSSPLQRLSAFDGNAASRDESINKGDDVLPQTSHKLVRSNAKSQDPTPEEDEEERRVREEIENTQKRLVWLQEQQNKLKKQKEEKLKRHSMDLNPAHSSDAGGGKHPVWSSTLPRPPGHYSKSDDKLGKETKLSPDQQKDVEELLRSVQELDFMGSKPPLRKILPNMASATLPTRSQETTSRFKPNVSENGRMFTPAYAHPMHQPQHMQLHHYQLQSQEENRRKSTGARGSETHQRIPSEKKENKKEIAMQERKREEERARQERFQFEFEQKQKQLLQEKLSHKPPVQPLIDVQPPMPAKSQSTIQAEDTSANTSSSVRNQNENLTTNAAEKSDELQMQLDELDHYIAMLSSSIETTAPSKPAVQQRTSSVAAVRRRRSFSIELERKMDPDVPLTPDDDQQLTIRKPSVPRPPSRTKSSFDSVSRRLSHGFELAQLIRQNSNDRDIHSSTRDDDVFMPQTVQPSYPPQTRHTRPIQQQIVGGPPDQSKLASQKPSNTEEHLSPKLFLAMALNPGARPTEDIHSYKEDLDPIHLSAVDGGASSSTPNFPLSPATPFVNLSTSSSQSPAGLAKTPLSALGLKPVSDQESVKPSELQERSANYPRFDGATKQQVQRVNGVTSSNVGPSETRLLKENSSSNGKCLSARLENSTGSTLQSNEIISKNTSPNMHQASAKTSLITHRSQDSGFSDVNLHQQSSNGWMQHSQTFEKKHSTRTLTKESELKSPWIHSDESSPHSSSAGGKSVGHSFAYPSPSEEASPSNASRSLTGSNDSLLSEESSSSQPQFAYQQQRLMAPPNLPFSHKDNSQRNSGSSIRSSSTGGSGYLGGTSRTSPHSAGSPTSSAVGQYPLSRPTQRRESQLSSYDRQGLQRERHAVSTDDGGLSSPVSERTSSSSTSDIDRMTGEMSTSGMSASTPKFIRDTTSYWYKPDITREQALAMLRSRPPGSFVVRDSKCYRGCFGLAIKVQQVPAIILAAAKPGMNINNELVRHFLIESSPRGVKLKGFANEPVFGSLSALVYQHSITPLALPCPLLIPSENQEIPQPISPGRSGADTSNTNSDLLRQGAACNVLYLISVDTESLTGPDAIDRSMRECIANINHLKTSIVHFKVSPQGITLTDNARKIFFRRHYPTASLTCCELDPSHREPRNRRWDASSYRGPKKARVFGFVAKKPGSTVDNVCHLFAELDLEQPAPAIVSFVNKYLLGLS